MPLNTNGVSVETTRDLARRLPLVIAQLEDEALPHEEVICPLVEVRELLDALLAPPADDDGPEVFLVSGGKDDPYLFTTRVLADAYAQAVGADFFGPPLIEQQTVCGPTRAAKMIADEQRHDEPATAEDATPTSPPITPLREDPDLFYAVSAWKIGQRVTDRVNPGSVTGVLVRRAARNWVDRDTHPPMVRWDRAIDAVEVPWHSICESPAGWGA